MAGTPSKETKISVSADNVTFEDLCIFGGTSVDFGTHNVNEEFCLSSAEPIITLGDTTYEDKDYLHIWAEGAGSAGNAIVQTAHTNKTKIYVRTEMNNSAGTNGTQYTAEFMVSKYQHQINENEVVKTNWTCKQFTKPVEVASA